MILKIKNKFIINRNDAWKSYFVLCFIGIIVLPLLIGTFYTLPSADDFSNTIAVGRVLQNNNNNIFMAACMQTKETYMDWQGTFTGAFLIYAYNPLRTWGIAGIRVLLFFNVLFLTISVLWCGNMVAKLMFGLSHKNTKLLFLSVLIFVSLGICRGGQEIFYWFTGACMYTMPMSLTFCCLALYMRYLWEKRMSVSMVLLCVLAFLASGGVLQVTAILCWGMLVLWFLYFREHRNKDGILSGLPFMVSFIGALINAFAPGNFVRHMRFEERVHVFKALKNVLKIMFWQSKEAITDNLFLYIMIFGFLLGAFMVSKSELKTRKYHPILFFMALLVGLSLSIFPVCLGYASAELGLRNLYVCDLYIGWGSVVCAMEFGAWFGMEKRHLCADFFGKKGLILALLCIMLFVFCRTGEFKKLFDEASGRTFDELRKGDIQRCSEEWLMVLNEIKDSNEDRVVVQVTKSPNTILKSLGLSEDEMNWVNQAIAQYYGKETVKINVRNE